jgi:hypothetical protein
VGVGESDRFYQIDSILPYSYSEVEFSTPYTPFGVGMPDSIVVSSLDSTVTIDAGRRGAIITSSLGLVVLLVGISLVLMYKFNKLRPMYDTLRARYAKAIQTNKTTSYKKES